PGASSRRLQLATCSSKKAIIPPASQRSSSLDTVFPPPVRGALQQVFLSGSDGALFDRIVPSGLKRTTAPIRTLRMETLNECWTYAYRKYARRFFRLQSSRHVPGCLGPSRNHHR